MGKKKEYSNSYAQVRKFNDHNISICYWNNNVSINDFNWSEGTGFVYEHEGEYQGLRAKMKLTVDERKIRRLFRRMDERGPIRFRGTLDHMGIRIHMRRNAFPAKQSGEIDGLRYTIELSGTDKMLSYADDKVLHKRRRECMLQAAELSYKAKHRQKKHPVYQEVPKYLQDGARCPFQGGSCTPR